MLPADYWLSGPRLQWISNVSVKFNPASDYKRIKEKQKYISTLSLTSALDAALPLGKNPDTHCTEESGDLGAATDWCGKSHPHWGSNPESSRL
jgi:hypothetical protein